MAAHNYFPGFLIAIEGIDGSGKTTQAHLLQETLQAKKHAVVRTKEPTTGQWGQILRDSAVTGRLSPQEEVDAFIKDRREHVANQIEPELQAGHFVIIDRYYFSNVAYQGACGIDPAEILRRNEEFAPEPDLLILLDVDPRVALARIKMRGDRANHFERGDNLKKVRQIFLSIEKPYLFKVDAGQEADAIAKLIRLQLNQAYAERIAHSNLDAKSQLSAALQLFGGQPL